MYLVNRSVLSESKLLNSNFDAEYMHLTSIVYEVKILAG